MYANDPFYVQNYEPEDPMYFGSKYLDYYDIFTLFNDGVVE